EAALGAVLVTHAGGAALPVRMSVSASTSTCSRTLLPPEACRRTTSSARRMSIFPWRRRLRYETSCSSRVSSSISCFSSVSERLARSGSGSTASFRSKAKARISKAKAKVEILAEGGGFLRLHDLLDDPPELALELLRLLLGAPLRVDVDE